MIYERVCDALRRSPKRFLVTGAAGFIGSNIAEKLLVLGQDVVALDNLSTGHANNLVRAEADARGAGAAGKLTFVEADIRDAEACKRACAGIDVVLHQAALGSVPRSIAQPLVSHASNVDGFLNMLDAARQAGVGRFVYASSSSVYGDSLALPKVEDRIGKPLSPYALTKLIDEQYAEMFARTYGFRVIGLRYFNVFGKRQDPNGPYAAVIPKWIDALLAGRAVEIYGDGETSRDFCYIDNVVQMNLLAGAGSEESLGRVYNVAFGDRTSLNDLFRILVEGLMRRDRLKVAVEAVHGDFRSGDVRHSLADISLAKSLLGYEPRFDLTQGLDIYLDWYCDQLRPASCTVPR